MQWSEDPQKLSPPCAPPLRVVAPTTKSLLHHGYRTRVVIRNVLWIIWLIIRVPVLAVLLVFEPFVSFILATAGFLGIVVALILKSSGDLPHFPFWVMMAASVGAILLLMVYHLLIRLFSR